MTKRDEQARPSITVQSKSDSKAHVTREYLHRLRGKFKGKDLLNALMIEKKSEKQGRRQHP